MRIALLLASLPLFGAPRGVEILWDSYGVPHVYGKTVEGMFFGYGYAQMQSHGNLILKLYGESRGRASEYWGQAYNASDRWLHTNDVPERGLEWYKRQNPEFTRYLDAFAAGMNEYATRHPEKLDEQMKLVLPVTGADPVIHTHRIMHFSYVSSQARVRAAITGRSANPFEAGSNGWAIGPSRGGPTMLMNPHLSWQDWQIYYEAHLNGPKLNLYGASQVGFPVLRFCFNDSIAYTHTVNSIDGSDLYKIELEGDGYRLDGAKREFVVREKSFLVKRSDGGFVAEKFVVKSTVHGPVVWESDAQTIALRTAGLDRPHALDQYWRMSIAGNFEEYEKQLKRLEVPTFNILYADSKGHIHYLFNGLLPRRQEGDAKFWAGVVPGNSSKYLWTDYHRYDELPQSLDPPTGFLQNTNDPPWSSTWPQALDASRYPAYTAAARPEMWRTARSLRMLTEDSKIDFEELERYKYSTRSELADRVIDELVRAVETSDNLRAKESVKVLKTWDRQMETNSRGALLFELIAPKLQFAEPLDPKRPLETPRGLKQEPNVLARIVEEASIEAERNYGRIDARWGEWRRFKLGSLDIEGNGGGGALGIFRVMTFAGQVKKYPVHGDTFVCLVQLGRRPKARVVTSYGNSSQKGSPHVEDQLPLVAAKQMRDAWRERKDVETHLKTRDVF